VTFWKICSYNSFAPSPWYVDSKLYDDITWKNEICIVKI